MISGSTSILKGRSATGSRVYVSIYYRPRRGDRRKPKSITLTVDGTSDVGAVANRIRGEFNRPDPVPAAAA